MPYYGWIPTIGDESTLRNPGLPDWIEGAGLHILEDCGNYLEISVKTMSGERKTAKVKVSEQYIRIEWECEIGDQPEMEDSCLVYDSVKEMFHKHTSHSGHRMLNPVRADKWIMATPVIGEDIIRMCVDRRWFMESTKDMALLSDKYKECSGLLYYGQIFINRFDNDFDKRRHTETIESLKEQMDRIYSTARDRITVDLTLHTVETSERAVDLSHIVIIMTWTTIVSALVTMYGDMSSAESWFRNIVMLVAVAPFIAYAIHRIFKKLSGSGLFTRAKRKLLRGIDKIRVWRCQHKKLN